MVSDAVSPTTGTHHYVRREDGSVYYVKTGQGEPLIFLHALSGGGRSWSKIVPYFAPHFTCLNIDLPGFDHSDIPPRAYNCEDYTAAVLDVLKSAGIAKTNIVSGHFGADIALELAANHPEVVNKVVMDGLPYWNQRRGQVVWERSASLNKTDTTSYDVPVAPLTPWEDAKAANPDLAWETWEKGNELFRRSRRWASLSEEKALCAYDGEAVAGKVTAPVLLLYGEADPLRRAEERARNDIKGSTYKLIEGASMVHTHPNPEVLVGAALPFLLEP